MVFAPLQGMSAGLPGLQTGLIPLLPLSDQSMTGRKKGGSQFQWLIVAGGGGGGRGGNGGPPGMGAGGGEVLTGSGPLPPIGSYSVVVGAGGPANQYDDTLTAGGVSSFMGLTARGGHPGSSYNSTPSLTWGDSGNLTPPGAAGWAGNGSPGGAGAGGPSTAAANNYNGGVGGPGVLWPLNGVRYGGGGGGGGSASGSMSAGGSDGGGQGGGGPNVPGNAGTPNTGGGGGGGTSGNGDFPVGGAGGSGVVIIAGIAGLITVAPGYSYTGTLTDSTGVKWTYWAYNVSGTWTRTA